MSPAKNFEGYDFRSHANFVQGSLTTTKNLLNFWDYAQGAVRESASSGQKLVSHIIRQSFLKISAR